MNHAAYYDAYIAGPDIDESDFPHSESEETVSCDPLGDVTYGWNGYYECWVGIDRDGRTVYVPEEGPGELPGCADPATRAGP